MTIRSLLFLFAFSASVSAQAPGVPIFDQSREGLKKENIHIGREASALLENGHILTLESVKEAMENPEAVKVPLKKATMRVLEPAAIAKKAQASIYRVGWAYLCPHCDHWHTNLGGGYAVSDDGVLATCAHVVDPEGIKMRKGCLVAVSHTGQVFPVTKIHAYHDQMDAALVRIDSETKGLALNDQVSPGDAAFCLSRPLKQGKYFTRGIINRFYWNSNKRGKDESSLEALGYLKMNVSSRWAPGSSGSPVLDQFGNVIGHVATIKALGNNAKKDKESFITLHSATPARGVMALMQP
ncbi:MAG: S1 family peptidase [Akkermansiaceae bacterium]